MLQLIIIQRYYQLQIYQCQNTINKYFSHFSFLSSSPIPNPKVEFPGQSTTPLQLCNYQIILVQSCTRHQVIYPSILKTLLLSTTDRFYVQKPHVHACTYTHLHDRHPYIYIYIERAEKRHYDGVYTSVGSVGLTLRSLEIPSGLMGSHYEANRTEIITGR